MDHSKKLFCHPCAAQPPPPQAVRYFDRVGSDPKGLIIQWLVGLTLRYNIKGLPVQVNHGSGLLFLFLRFDLFLHFRGGETTDLPGGIMYTLLSGIYKSITEKEDFFVLILGLDNAGKTTFLEAAKAKFGEKKASKSLLPSLSKDKRSQSDRMPLVNPAKITTTVGLNIGRIDTQGIRLNFWDLGGQEELQALWDKYYAECHAVIFTVDSNDRERMSESKAAFDGMIANSNIIGVPLLVLANKQDLHDCMGVREVKPIFQDNDEKIGNRECMVMPTSALTGDGVMEGIEWLIDCIQRNLVNRPPGNDDKD
eukprot:maker-scaffold564_size136232-snap-gene-0.29 protein:Tk11643 transcript:maker-scaffold564_size136232-snap-gene-0.29-mRNA-1 annotation:"adp-ribosylation factor-related protein 1"